MDDVHCVGNEASIADCGHGGWGVHNCDHSRDVSVLCGTSPVEYGNFINSSLLQAFWILISIIIYINTILMVLFLFYFFSSVCSLLHVHVYCLNHCLATCKWL